MPENCLYNLRGSQLTVDSSMDPLTLMVLASSRCSSARGVSSSISALARQPFRGVRTSWHLGGGVGDDEGGWVG